MNGKLSTRPRADRCAPSVFVALTTALPGIEPECALRDPVVIGHARRGRLERLPARDVAPAGDRPEPIVADERGDDDSAATGTAQRDSRFAPKIAPIMSGGIRPAV